MGDFLQCKKPGCIWGATWSMGHICNYCHLQPCVCPCPLTKEWLEEHKFEIGLKRVFELLIHDKGSIEVCRRMAKRPDNIAFGESNKQKWHSNGTLEEIRRLFSFVPQLQEMREERDLRNYEDKHSHNTLGVKGN